MTTTLTQPQRDVLMALRYASEPMGGHDLLRVLHQDHQTTQGVHRTAASLIRRGLVQRHSAYTRSCYVITLAGLNLIATVERIQELKITTREGE